MEQIRKLRSMIVSEVFSAARAVYLVQEKYDQALKLFSMLEEIVPDDPRVSAYVGRCYARRHQWSDCENAFNRALEAASRNAEPLAWIYRDWGHILARFKRYGEAKAKLEEAREAGAGSDPSLLAAEGVVAWKTGDVEGAIKTFERVLKIKPNHLYTLDMYARLLDQHGEKERAETFREKLHQYEGELDLTLPPDDIESEADQEEE